MLDDLKSWLALTLGGTQEADKHLDYAVWAIQDEIDRRIAAALESHVDHKHNS